jgi:hypothetical protein
MSKQKRQGGVIENWYIGEYPVYHDRYPESLVQIDEDGLEYSLVVLGNIYNDSKWFDGESLRTSLVVNITDEYVETLNTIYKLGKKREEHHT